MRLRLAALTLLTVLAFAAPAQAIVPTVEQDLAMSYHYWGGYCDGSTPEQSVQITYDATLPDRGLAGEATGIVFLDDTTYVLSACTISIQPGMDPPTKCRVIFHEVGHLANHRHSEGGIMAAEINLEIPFAPCDPTRREQVFQSIHDVLPGGYRWDVHCTPALTFCRARSLRAKHDRRFYVEDTQAFPIP